MVVEEKEKDDVREKLRKCTNKHKPWPRILDPLSKTLNMRNYYFTTPRMGKGVTAT